MVPLLGLFYAPGTMPLKKPLSVVLQCSALMAQSLLRFVLGKARSAISLLFVVVTVCFTL